MRRRKWIAALLTGAVLLINMTEVVSAKEDPYLKKKEGVYQYHLEAIHVKEAWALLEKKGYTRTKVGIIDTGIDPLHEDLKKNLKDFIEIKKGNIKKGVTDYDEHGTHVAGIIGATYGNGKGGTGIATGRKNDMVELYVAGVLDGDSLNDVDILKALRYFKEKKVRVVNMSLGGYQVDDEIKKEMEKLAEEGMIFIAASGNEDTNLKSSPASFQEVISVNATDRHGKATAFSDYGITTDLSAPGSEILSTLPGNRYGQMSGTSMATPMVSGVVALMLSANDQLTPKEVYSILCETAEKGGLRGKYFDEHELAYGRINALKAVEAAYQLKEEKEIPAKDLFLKETSLRVGVGYEEAIESLMIPGNSTTKVEYSSSDEEIFEVDQRGHVKGKKEGHGTLTVRAGEIKKEVDVTVRAAVLPSEIDVVKYKKILYEGETYYPYIRVLPFDSEIREWYIKSDRPETVVTSANYGLYARKSGKAVITVRTVNGIEKSFSVVVKPAVYKIAVKKGKRVLKVGEKLRFKAEVLNENGKKEVYDKRLLWKVTDPDLAKIDENTGVLTAKKEGSLYVKVLSRGFRKGGKHKAGKVIKIKITGAHPKKEKKKPGKRKGNKVSVFHLLDYMDEQRSLATELVSDSYQGILAYSTKYAKPVIQAAEKLREEILSYIAEADSDTNLLEITYDDVNRREEVKAIGKLGEYLDLFYNLSDFDNLKISDKKDVLRYKKSYIKKIKTDMKDIPKDVYNDYYRKTLRGEYRELLKKAVRVKDMADLIKVITKYDAVSGGEEKIVSALYDVTDFEAIYTREDLKTVRNAFLKLMKSYAQDGMKLAGKTGKTKKLLRMIKRFQPALKKSYYMGELIDLGFRYFEKLKKEAGVKPVFLTNGDRIRNSVKLDLLIARYKRSDYKRKTWKKIRKVMNVAYEKNEGAVYQSEVYKLVERAKKKLDRLSKEKK